MRANGPGAEEGSVIAGLKLQCQELLFFGLIRGVESAPHIYFLEFLIV